METYKGSTVEGNPKEKARALVEELRPIRTKAFQEFLQAKPPAVTGGSEGEEVDRKLRGPFNWQEKEDYLLNSRFLTPIERAAFSATINLEKAEWELAKLEGKGGSR